MKWRGACLNPGVPYSRLAASAAVLLALLPSGCKSTHETHASAAPGGKLFAVTSDSAPFFRHGPQQGRDPDSKLARDTVVRLIRPSFGYSKVELVSSGEKGYVSSEEIRPAPASLIAAALAGPADSAIANTVGPQGETFNIDSNDPRLVPPPEQLPAPDLPPAALPPGQ